MPARKSTEKSIRRIAAACLLLLTLIALSAHGQEPAKELSEAERAVKAKNFSEARDKYRQLSQRYPDNPEFLIWIGRLSRYMGDLPAAVASLDQALSLAPQNVGALVEKALALMSMSDFQAARKSLILADRDLPENTDVQLAWARYHHLQGNDQEANGFIRRVLIREPENDEALALKSQLVSPEPLTVGIGYAHDDFSFASPGNMGYLTVGYKGAGGLLTGRYERWRRFAEDVNRGGFGLTRQFGKRVTLRGGTMWAPHAAVLPRQDYTGGVSYAAAPWVIGADYRRLRFTSANVSIVGPSFEYYFQKPVWMTGALYRSRTELTGTGTVDSRTASLVRYFQQVSPRWIWNGGYARGSDVFPDLSIDRLGTFRSNIFIGGVTWKGPNSVTVDLHYDYENRSNGTHVQSLGLSVSR